MPSSPPLLCTNNLSFSYSSKDSSPLFEDLSFSLKQGETLAILGPSGCGKTSLLYLLCGLLSPSSGKITFEGNELQGFPKHAAVILQSYGLFPWKTVWQNTVLGLHIQGKLCAEQKEKASDLLHSFGLAKTLDRFPHELSEGQKQRVAIARSLLMEPKLLLMDEPFSSLDSSNCMKMHSLIQDIWERKKFSLILVTHDIEEALFLGQKIFFFSSGKPENLTLQENPLAFSDRSSSSFFKQYVELRKKVLLTSP